MNTHNHKNPLIYKGRFAPSPTGELHFGSLLAAISSYLEARKHNGDWIIRMEDLDQPRTVAGSADSILQTLDTFGFEWDGEVVFQSQRSALYEDYLQQLISEHLIYRCDCSRNKLKENKNFPVYDGFCRNKNNRISPPYALRCKTPDASLSFTDQIQGNYSVELNRQCGDFIVRRRDQLFAYQLAVICDDAEQAITDIVRGADLLAATPVQIYLQQQLQLAEPVYSHIPVAMHQQGRKLSKSHQDLAITSNTPAAIMTQALSFLGQSPPEELAQTDISEFWHWAFKHWDLSKIPAINEQVFCLEQ